MGPTVAPPCSSLDNLISPGIDYCTTRWFSDMGGYKLHWFSEMGGYKLHWLSKMVSKMGGYKLHRFSEMGDYDLHWFRKKGGYIQATLAL
jgi:hypothetical protein